MHPQPRFSANNMTIRYTLLAIAVTGLAAAILPIQAGVVYLKDGSAIHGSVKQERELIFDPATGQPVPIVKKGNSFLMDDRARYVIFGPKQVASVDETKDFRDGHIVLQLPLVRATARKKPDSAIIGQPGPFNDKWERMLPITVFQNPVNFFPPGAVPPNQGLIPNAGKVRQRVTILTPYFFRAETVEYDWSSNYLTSELGPQAVLTLVRSHPEIAKNPDEFDQQFKVFRFCTQAGWLDIAQAELAALRGKFPGEKQRLDVAEQGFRQLSQQKAWEDAELASRVGQHEKAQRDLQRIVMADLPVAMQPDVANLRAKYEANRGKLQSSRDVLNACFFHVMGPPTEFFAEAIPAIADELTLDNLDRAEAFTALGRQLQNDIKAGREPKQSANEVLALAITSWMIGPEAADTSIATAERMWSLRQRLFEYLRTPVTSARQQLLKRIEAETKLSVPEIARIISQLPPAEGYEGQPGLPAERKTNNPFSGFAPHAYTLLLPPEYHPGRSWPLLIVLPNAGQSTAQAVAEWAAEATKNGYVLASVDWGTLKSKYEYEPQEHAAALECLRDVGRFLNIDTDRVFLAGMGEGGNAAFDVGLSHPDRFAGVIPFNGRPRWYASQWYRRNAQNLPFYLVIGEFMGESRTWPLNLYENWLEKGYPALMVMYKGRTIDFFPGEVPHVFDWMNRQRRATAFPDLGRNPNAGFNGEEYQTLRSGDHHFYWLSTSQIMDRFTLKDFAKGREGTAAAMQASIKDGNNISVYTRGLKQVSVWLGRTYDSQTGVRDMIDFSKPVKIVLNNRTTWTNQNKPIEPSLETLLEDFYARTDRRRLFLAKVDFNNLQ